MIQRTLSQAVRQAAEKLPVITITGPRQSGKTTLVRAVFPEHTYANLEYPDTREYALTNPRGFLRSAPRMIIDEVQHAPDLTSYCLNRSLLPSFKSSSSTGDSDRRITSGETIPVMK